MNKQKLLADLSAGGLLVCICLCLFAGGAVATAGPNFDPFGIGLDSTRDQNGWTFNLSRDWNHPKETQRGFGDPHNSLSLSLSFDLLGGVLENLVSGAGSLHQNQIVNLVEHITIDSNPQLTDWDETLATPNFVWNVDNDADGDDPFYTINGGPRQFTGISYSPDKTTLYIDLPADLPAGSGIVLHQQVEYVGTASFNNNNNPIVLDQVVIAPVPEPSTVAVFGLGVVLALISRRRSG